MKRVVGAAAILACLVVALLALTVRDAPRRTVPDATPEAPPPSAEPPPSVEPPPRREGTSSIAGTVVDAVSGELIDGIDVLVGDVATTTGGGGRFRIEVPPGTHVVRAVADDATSPERTLKVEAGTEATVELRLARVAVVAGRVVDDGGRPVAGAEIVADPDNVGDGPVATGSDGGFAVRVAPGKVKLVARRGDAQAEIELAWVAPATERHDIELVLASGSAIEGFVRLADGSAADGARVAVEIAGHRAGIATNPDGSFRLERLINGHVVIAAHLPGHAPARAELDLAAASEARIDLVLAVGASVSGRVVGPDGEPAAARVAAVLPTPLAPLTVDTLDGRFLLEGLPPGKPIALVATAPGFGPARASVTPPTDVTLALSSPGTLVVHVTGDASVTDVDARLTPGGPAHFTLEDGAFRVPNLEPRSYDLVVTAPGFAPAKARVTVAAGGTSEVTIELTRGATLDGTVVDGDGRPVSGSRVRLLSGHGGDGAITDDEGRFTLSDVATGRRTVIVEHPDVVTREESLAVDADETIRVRVRRRTATDATVTEFAGIGAILRSDGERLFIDRVLPASPAENAGVRKDDELVAIDGAAAGRDVTDAVETIRGPEGTSVRLTLSRDGVRVEVTIVRATIRG